MVKKVNVVDTSGLVKQILMLGSMRLKVLYFAGLATTSALNAVDNKISDVNILVKKTDCDAKISGIESKCFTTSDYNILTNNILDAKVKHKKLVNESNTPGFVKKFDLNKMIKTLVTKAELKAEHDKIVKLHSFHSSYFCGKSHFGDDETQNYLVFQPIYRLFKKIGNTDHISA